MILLLCYNNIMRYRTEVVVKYGDTREYRHCCRELFEMDHTIYEKKVQELRDHNKEELDDETLDELAYDGDATTKVMDFVFEQTKGVAEFRELYQIAALRMFSEDPNIGLAVLFSYDYMERYHSCLVEFFSGRFSKDLGAYRELMKLLS